MFFQGRAKKKLRYFQSEERSVIYTYTQYILLHLLSNTLQIEGVNKNKRVCVSFSSTPGQLKIKDVFSMQDLDNIFDDLGEAYLFISEWLATCLINPLD